MKIRIIKKFQYNYSEKLIEKGLERISSPFKESLYGDDERAVEISIPYQVTLDDLKTLKSIAEELNDRFAIHDMNIMIELFGNTDMKKIKSLKGFIRAFTTYIKKDKIDGWIYSAYTLEEKIPYLVSDIHHVPANPEYDRKASVKLSLTSSSSSSSSGGKKDHTISFSLEQVHGKTLFEILTHKGLSKETEELKIQYEEHIKHYNLYHQKIGHQFISNKHNFVGHKLINDQVRNSDESYIKQTTVVSFYNEGELVEEIDEDDDESIDEWNYKRVEMNLPFHPYISFFDLETEKNVQLLASHVSEYQYDTNLREKLILPEEHKDLIDILVYDADVVLEDIVSNKSGGTNILCKGGAGLGKTLTAEVYAETIQKPLYSVHSGQLGTNPDKIDSNLDKILKRAEKWKAILILDEADVYIRKRDNSMEHNAIVAAFLRKIERFNGILFLTTNRADDIDDAIASRCIAMITYDYPCDEDLFKIWSVLGKHYKIDLSDDLIRELINLFEQTSGRDVKELLKLASKFKSQRDTVIDAELFRKCGSVRGLTAKKQ